MRSFVLDFKALDKTQLALVGGKGANLGELARIDDIRVPEGFCVSTEAFKQVIGSDVALNHLLDRLALLALADRDKIAELCAEIRRSIEAIAIPEQIQAEITQALAGLGENTPCAVRSSATAEDLPTASFAGQQDSYLNLIGREAILAHVSKCWASLFTERAVIYRLQNGFDQRKVQMAVIIQKMVLPQASGIMFTADPVTANRKVLVIDAGFGLGEALVSGLVSADCYKVQNAEIVDITIASKKLAIYGLSSGGTETKALDSEQQAKQTLTEEQILQLARIGRQIEAAFACPQDIEWCLAEDTFYIVQSRPITTLFPLPEVNDQENHVYLSVGHQQMMTDPMKPLGLSLFLLTTSAPMLQTGGRLFVDCTKMLESPARRKGMLEMMKKGDPLMQAALLTLLERDGFIKTVPDVPPAAPPAGSPQTPPTAIEDDPKVVSDLIQTCQRSLAELKQNIQTKSGLALIEFVLEDIKELKRILALPQSMAVIMAAMNAAVWLNDKMNEWLGEKNVADTLSLSVPNNITSEMGLELLDVADRIRPFPEVIAYLQTVKDEPFLDELQNFQGGREARAAILAYLDKYGMRCAGEIDLTNTRWSENPATLVPLILSNIKNFEPGASKRKFEQLQQEAAQKEQDLLARLRQLPEGEQKAAETQTKIRIIRDFSGYREYPKYFIINRYFVYKQAVLKIAEQLVQSGLLHDKEDIYYLTFAEIHEVMSTNKLDYPLIKQRQDDYKRYEKLNPPRVFTSDGEIITGKFDRGDIPAGALSGIPVSTGIIEGRARVVFKMEEANIEEGDILVTTFTDPSWTPLFVSLKGLITEVGGTMTHGAVIAREYGLPAVVSVENATRLIQDGQRIRVNGTDGYVEILA